MDLRPGYLEKETRVGDVLKAMVGHPEPLFRTETFIPKTLSGNYPQARESHLGQSHTPNPGAAASTDW